MDYFKYFPQLNYSNQQSINILARTKIREYLKKNTYLFYQYVLNDDERADILSERYYGSWKYTWIIFYANDIFDPIRDWVKSENEFMNYINYKYSYNSSEQMFSPQINKKTYNLIKQTPSLYSIVVSRDPVNGETTKQFLLPEQDYILSQDRKQITFDFTSTGFNNSLPLNIYIAYPTLLETTNLKSTEVFGFEGRPGFEIAHQTIHHYENSYGYVVNFEDWYYETISELSRHPYDWSQYNNNSQVVRIRNQNGIPTFIKMKTVSGNLSYDNKTIEGNFSNVKEDLSNRLSVIRVDVLKDNVIETVNLGIEILSNSNTKIVLKDPITNAVLGSPLVYITYFSYSDVQNNEYYSQRNMFTSDGGQTYTRYNPNSFVAFSFNDSSKKVISNFRYEYDKNESKRTIKLLDKKYLGQIVNEFRELLGE